MGADRFSTATRLKALGTALVQGPSAARVYRARTPRRSRLTGRAALLALVVCSLVVALAYPMRQWVTQRSDIADQRRQTEHAREQVKRLRDEKARLEDPAYVEQQAREHLHYVRPGETGFSVVDGSGAAKRPKDQGAGDRPWYSNLWEDVDTADGHR
ncbi:acyl-phosphate glycerol 3-phosphate acyltransferase [Streptomyces cinnamoneus]|uniref:Acyl-phosphate glycerol 3-phosphate acyltransferase n=1 Tax=Streptomyces cinnamoneus TaxID=53446 RepID=A0A2G1XJ51_STRCJ|nr:septum formation initiator family protein [Streptomyces cinnamoneus]PHQ51257.1 acyl-phosphate glycerol 3-phosphate acyltransferase [Streptomyces cinnamoneus]PPT13517.1 acyl-phosphate glycerol 3-phosphate acyltransferase [Streptomyces cinnamoneus]